MRHRASLKQRLLALILGVIALVWLGATAFTYLDAREEFDEVLDAHLAQAAALLLVQTTHDLDELETEQVPMLHKYSRRVAFQVWEEGKRLVLHSANAPQQPLAEIENGFSDRTLEGKRWRVFSSRDESGTYLIHVAESADVRDELAADIAGNLLRPLLFSLPLLAILLWVAVARGLQPLAALAREVERREPENLAALDTSAAPREVLPLIERLNRLFARIAVSLQKERSFTADAAHELRTPIAAIKAQTQVARMAASEAERIHALDNALLGCDRASRLITQLLTLAQVDTPRVDTLDRSVMEACQLKDIAAETIADLAPSALEKGVQLELLAAAETDATVPGNPELLRVLLRNLLDNAILHTPGGTTVQVNISREQKMFCLSVSDNGPGIPEAERSKVLDRFYRPLGTQASGSGLGLSIVKRIAEVHNATLQILPVSKGSGLTVKVCFRF
ncbi:MAG: hypothetical protein B7Y56_05455 [Gallionellales bacterium 35-53-114]|jgi:two-component system sensor histidine kinase QseC|nr:MAG: hypothetical protein B7Y56_05455 [Gallionellales bacterium 35-53-114]OYZ62553.1 MAG: hypothetical protein B7Y04_11755 [Gallionellales bacterium 24-53-125]OZB09512.1 MAG: hypothetical protein B7X61_07645 [Gallionellales bacterium 39-52-133]HQS57821.1 ATP-binding protein [Gallionellaceae bacterium]HQS74274.1 ATP-binding protein [Gallionellaceae bacterium]